MTNTPTTKDVANFMKDQLEKKKILYQVEIAEEIKKKFGSEFVDDTDTGFSIKQKVLRQFVKITPNVIYDGVVWRNREETDLPNSRRQY